MNTFNLNEINSAGIRAQGIKDGITHVTRLAQAGVGDRKITVYQFGDVRVADTNGDPVWEESDPEAFAALLLAGGDKWIMWAKPLPKGCQTPIAGCSRGFAPLGGVELTTKAARPRDTRGRDGSSYL